MRFLYQLGSTWLHFGSKNLPKSRLGGVLGRLGGLLRRLGRVLERLGLILERLGASWRRLEASWARLEASGARHVTPGAMVEPSAEPGTQLRRAPEADNNQREERRKTLERLPTERLQKESECRE